MEEETIFVLFDLCGDLKEGEDDRRGLGLRQWSMSQGVGASSMVQGRGRTREHQPHRVRQEGRGRGASTVEVSVHSLDGVCAIATGAIQVFVEHVRGWSVQRRDDKAGGIVCAHDFRLQHDPPGLSPGLGGRDELGVEAATDRRRLAMGLGERAPLLRQTPCLLEGGSGLAEQDGMASQAKDQSGPPPMCEHVDDLWGSQMTITADQDMGVGPGAAQRGQEAHEDHGMFCPRGADARP